MGLGVSRPKAAIMPVKSSSLVSVSFFLGVGILKEGTPNCDIKSSASFAGLSLTTGFSSGMGSSFLEGALKVGTLNSAIRSSIPLVNADCVFCSGAGSGFWEAAFKVGTLNSDMRSSMPFVNTDCVFCSGVGSDFLEGALKVGTLNSDMRSSMPFINADCCGAGSGFLEGAFKVGTLNSAIRSSIPLIKPLFWGCCCGAGSGAGFLGAAPNVGTLNSAIRSSIPLVRADCGFCSGFAANSCINSFIAEPEELELNGSTAGIGGAGAGVA